MSNLSINQLLLQLQNTPPPPQAVADAASSDPAADHNTAATADGQNLPDTSAETAAAANTEGASAPVLSSDMNAVLLQLQESQDMNNADALLFGDSSASSSLLGAAGDESDPLQAFLDQMNATSASLTSSNQTLLDYLNGTATGTADSSSLDSLLGITGDASQTSSDPTLLDYLNGADSATAADPTAQASLLGSATDPTVASANQTLLDYLNAVDTRTTPDPSTAGQQAPLGVDTPQA